MGQTSIAVLAAGLFALTLTSCATESPQRARPPRELVTVATPLPDAMGEMRKTFRARYDEAVVIHEQRLRTSYPIITQDLLNMTLLRAGAPSERFSMKSGAYMLMAHTSHPVLTVYSILSTNSFGDLSAEQRQQLQDLDATLGRGIESVRSMELSDSARGHILVVLESTRRFVAETTSRGRVSRAEFAEFASSLRDPISQSFRIGANEQLVQFRAQISRWRQQFPNEKWDELRVVVLGFHQARDQYALRQFFDWLLREPGFEDRVVFAEFQGPISGASREAAEQQALRLLTKVDFEHDAATLIFNEKSQLQRDVMGPAATEILEGWGTSDLPRSR